MAEHMANFAPLTSPPSPGEILHRALSYIEPDGVRIFDTSESIWYTWQSHVPIELNQLPNDVYARHLMEAARTVAGSVSRIIFDADPLLIERELRRLALYLSAYTRDRFFLEAAASLVAVDDSGQVRTAHVGSHVSLWEWGGTVRSSQA
jgi:hypothetical protein